VTLKLSVAEGQLHLLGKSTKVSGTHEHSPISLPKSAIHQIEIIATTPKFQKAFQDVTIVIQSLGTAKVWITCGKSTKQYTISKVRYIKKFGAYCIILV